MIKNYFKSAWRILWKSKGYSAINMAGLAIGMAAVLIIALWVQNQWRYDNFYSHSKDLYKLWNRSSGSGEVSVSDITSGPVANTLKETYPEVVHAARMYWASDRLLSYKDKALKSTGNEVDKPFLEMFDFPLVKGRRDRLMEQQNSIVLTESLAKSLFGQEDPINKIITLDNKAPYTVTGVLQDLPGYSDFSFSYLVPLTATGTYSDSWNTNTYYTYVQLKAGADAEAFNSKIRPLVTKYAPDLKSASVFLFPMSRMHLYSRFENGVAVGGKIEEVRLVAGIGLLILLVACINFVNLSTARSQKRSKEVGVRKVVGASKASLVGQFLAESMLLSLFAGMIAMVMASVALPWFNQIMDKPLVFEWSDPFIWLGLLAFTIFVGILAGLYPAFFLSAFRPVKTLSGTIAKQKRVLGFREVLVVLQFGIAVVLIIATLIVRRQIDFASERNIGYDRSQLIEIPAEGDVSKRYEAIKAELLSSGAASSVTRTGWTVTLDGSSTGGNISWEGSTPEQEKEMGFSLARAESDFVQTLGLTLVGGRDIDYARIPADSSAVLLNEAAIKAMKLADPVGKTLKWGDRPYTIVGVFKDFIIGSPYRPIDPMMVTASKDWMFNIAIRMNKAVPLKQDLKTIGDIFKKFNPAYPFNYQFVDQQFALKFREQEQTALLSLIFSSLAIFISCLGLFGLASYIAETRTKEIGIRKVLGATVSGIAMMLSKDFIKLVCLAIVIATPIAWWAMNKWLQDFAYRIDIQWWMFGLAGLMAVLIALATVSWQAIRAAVANPVESLRDE